MKQNMAFFLNTVRKSVKHETSATVKNFKTENLKRMYQKLFMFDTTNILRWL